MRAPARRALPAWALTRVPRARACLPRRYAMRRYSRFQGYSFAAALGAGLLVWGGVKLEQAREAKELAAKAPKHA